MGGVLLIKPGRRQHGKTTVCLENEAGGLFQHPVGSIRWDTEQAKELPAHGNRSRCECFGRRP